MKRVDILYSKRRIRQMHPLYNLEIELCLPFFDPCIGVARRCFQKHFDMCHGGILQQSQNAGREKQDFTNLDPSQIQEDGSYPGEDVFDFYLEEDEDAMGRLGYGVVSYFSLIYTFL